MLNVPLIAGEGGNKFIFRVKTTGSAEDFTLPLFATGTYDFNISWGDGQANNITVWNEAAVTHTYADAGAHQIQIHGTIIGFGFQNIGHKTKIYELMRWGCLQPEVKSAFYGCSNLTVSATDQLNTTGMTSFESFFRSCSSLVSLPNCGRWDTSNIDSFKYTFSGCVLFVGTGVGDWDVSNSTTFLQTFYNCHVFNTDLDSWDVSTALSFHLMFYACYLFNGNVATWNVSSGETFSYMFGFCDIFNQDLSSWVLTTATGTGLRYMFYKCLAFTSDLSGLGITSNITSFESMFDGCLVFDSDLSAWIVSAVTLADNMLRDATLSVANYDALLIGWEGQAVQDSVTFHGGDSKYTGGGVAATARADLIADHSWDITDGGIA